MRDIDFDEPFIEADPSRPQRPIFLKKSLKQKIIFYGINLLILPLVAIVYLTIIRDGLTTLIPVSQMPLHRLAIPGAGHLKSYDGFDRLSLSHIIALVAFSAALFLWARVFIELMGGGTLSGLKHRSPIVFWFIAAIVFTILLGDAALFFVGLQIQASSSWNETPAYVPIGTTVLYMCGLAGLGAYHADFHCSGSV